MFFCEFLCILLENQRISKNKETLDFSRALTGAAGENRTHDPVLTKDVRYHYATAAKNAGSEYILFFIICQGLFALL